MEQTPPVSLIRTLLHWPTSLALGIRLRLFLVLSKFGRLFKLLRLSRGKDDVDKKCLRDSEAFFPICASRVPASLLPTANTLQIPQPTGLDSVTEESPATPLQPTEVRSTPCPSQCSVVASYRSKQVLALSDTIEKLVGVSSTEFERYERNVKLPKEIVEYIIQPLTTQFSNPHAPNNWQPFVHPEGALYFFDDSRSIPVLTDGYLYDLHTFDVIEGYITGIMDYISSYGIALPSQTHLVLEQRNSGNCGYYFADHSNQCIFWLDNFDIAPLVDEVRIRHPSASHIGQEIRSYYWFHNELFPHVHDVPDDALRELIDILTHAIGDSLTSRSPTVPYSLDVLKNMLALVKDIHKHGDSNPGSACIVYRLLGGFYHERYLNLYGEKAARLNRDQSIHPERHRTLFIKIMSPFLLYGPETHLRKLEEMSVDSLVNLPSWSQLLDELTDEWKEFTLYATVLLNANVAFLAIQSVDTAAASPGHRSNAQRASYISIGTSVAAIILGLLLVRQHHTTLTRNFLANRSVSGVGLESLAVMYSLPYALLMWGTISFLAAFSFMCYTSGDKTVMVLISIAWVASALLLLWTISVSFEDKPYHYPWLVRQWWRLKDHIRQQHDTGRERIIGRHDKEEVSPA